MPKRILSAEDEPHALRLLRTVLEREGYVVVMAASAGDVLEQAAAGTADLVILGLQTGDPDFVAPLRCLKTGAMTWEIPAIVLLEASTEQKLLEVWKAGADVALTKPFNPEELIRFVKRILGDNDPDRGIGSMHGDLWVDVA